MPVRGAREAITKEVTSWEGVTTHPHRFGGIEYCYGERREIGHTHGDALVDILIPISLRDQLVAEGRAERHHVLPDIGAVTIFLKKPEDVQRAIEILRMSYDLAVKQAARYKRVSSQ
ncbi:MAG TPA: luciferase family protein [Anaerolineae bacterium]|nr:luciferase family protein [Anaerolineae bacterium]